MVKYSVASKIRSDYIQAYGRKLKEKSFLP